jgi:hypothetical protein
MFHLTAPRLPGTLRMDEEDGRLGPRARQPGRADVLTDAFVTSLRSTSSKFLFITGTPAVSFIPGSPAHHLHPPQGELL